MSGSIYFVQECPICGRKLNIRIQYLGRQVVCQHCRGQFLAQDPTNVGPHSHWEDVLRRAQELLENTQQSEPENRFRHPR
ncbi:MAG TPA: hypothetical protein PK777_10385 [Thermoguttaceae bacterium]|jgi:DNA-directed RNA polymerase subunit RPC12/RpoP|nr:hypothetical protein [Thermoguttaceae bacterium]HPP53348.1 hypothetical protein [Thermoguttaceae bacterium]